MGLSLGNLLAGQGSPGLCTWLLEEEGWAPSRGQGKQQEVAFWVPAGTLPSVRSSWRGAIHRAVAWQRNDLRGLAKHQLPLLPRKCRLSAAAAMWRPTKSLKRFNPRKGQFSLGRHLGVGGREGDVQSSVAVAEAGCLYTRPLAARARGRGAGGHNSHPSFRSCAQLCCSRVF